MTILLALAAAASAALSSAAVQAPTGGDRSEIVVHGMRDAKGAATDYIDKVLPNAFDVQLGRFEEPLCPSTVGLPDALRDEVLSRIRRVAVAAGVPLAHGGCTTNLLLVVVDDKAALIEGMRRKKDSYLYGLGTAKVKELATAPGPVVAWQISDVIGADGMPLRVDGDGFPRLFTTVPPSRLVNTTRKRLLGAVIVIEQKGLVQVDTRQLADFALMRSLTPLEPRERAAPATSILSLFDGGLKPADAPQSVTAWDLAFLKALAATRSDLVANLQRDEIRNRMLQEVSKGPTN
jgi:hypothetical protein